MKKLYKSENIACSNCANLIKVSLEDKYGEIQIDLETNPKEITLNIDNKQQEVSFKKDMSELGFNILED